MIKIAIKNTNLGGTDWSTPTARVKPTDLNDTFDEVASRLDTADENIASVDIVELYTSTGFDSTQAGVGNDEQSYEATAITAANLKNANYIEFEITAQHYVSFQAGGGQTELKVQTKEVGGSYADSTAYQRVLNLIDSDADGDIYTGATWKWVHTLTAGEKTNGVQYKIFSKSTVASGASSDASVTNKQTVVRLMR